MNSNIKVSVIVPIYNVEEYICDAINSLINQTLKEIEIICVDDCSTDSSYELLTSFKKKDDRIKVLRNTKNTGVGYSRNKALKIAKGEYISFLDSDDWLENKSLEELYNKSSENNLDILMFKAITYYQDSENFVKNDYYSMKYVNKCFNKIFDYKKFDKFKLFKLPNVAWNKFIKRSLLIENDISFPEGLIFEDVPFFYKLMFSAKRMMITDEYYYYRRIRENSIMTTYDIKLMDIISIYNLVMEFFLDNKLYNEYKRQLLNIFISVQKNRYYKIPIEHKEQFFNEMKKNIDKYAYQYNLKEDFENELYRPNKKFFNLILNSEDINDFNKNVNETKNIPKDYEFSIALEISHYDLKKINTFFRVVRNQKIDFENIQIILLVKKTIFEENNILNEYNDLYSNIKVINCDSLKEDYENESIRKNDGQKILFLNEKIYDSEEYDDKIKEFISCDGEKMKKNITVTNSTSKNIFHEDNPNQKNIIELNSEKNLTFFDLFNNTVVHNVLQQDKGIQGQYTDCWSEKSIVQRHESNTILKNESNKLLFSFLTDNDKKRLILPTSFKIKFRYINHDNVSLRLANLGGSYINISLNSLDLQTNDEFVISYNHNTLKIYVNNQRVKTNNFIMVENKGYITWRLPKKSFIKFNDFVVYTEDNILSKFFSNNSYDENYSRIVEELNKLEERIDVFEKNTRSVLESNNFLFNNLYLDYELKSKNLLKITQDLSTELLAFVGNVCKKYDLKWWLDYGTLLGAIRHQYFIPWDDDVDIGMMRKEYNILNNVIVDEIKENGLDDFITVWYKKRNILDKEVNSFLQIFDIHNLSNAKDTIFAGVDVFPYDFLKFYDGDTIKNLYYDTKLEYFEELSEGNDLKLPYNGLNCDSAIKNMYNSLNCDINDAQYIIPGLEGTSGPFNLYKLFILEKNDVFPLEKVNYGDFKFYAPKDYHKYLKSIYGKYMEIPATIRTHNRLNCLRYDENAEKIFESDLKRIRKANKNFKL